MDMHWWVIRCLWWEEFLYHVGNSITENSILQGLIAGGRTLKKGGKKNTKIPQCQEKYFTGTGGRFLRT